MRGEITTYDTTTSTGAIRAEDGSLYVFARHDIHTGSEIKTGQVVDFVPQGSTATQIVIISDAAAPASDPAAAFASAAGSILTATAPDGNYDFKSALFSFEGRLRRQHFWISWLICLGVGVVAGWLPIIGAVIGLALIWPNVAITVKRLHDMGKTGWLTLVPYIGMIIGVIIMVAGGAGAALSSAAMGGEPSQAAIMGAMGSIMLGGLVMLISNLGFLIWIGITDSQPGDNQYGPNPKGL